MAGVTPTLRVTATVNKRRRAGLSFTHEPVELVGAELTHEQIAQLLGDPVLRVEIRSAGENGEDGEFVGVSAEHASAITAELQAMADAAHAEAVASDAGKAARDATAPIGGGQTGSGFMREADQTPADPGEGQGELAEPASKTAAELATPEKTAPEPAPVPVPAPRRKTRAPAKPAKSGSAT